ncbi:site-specific integrase, partial [Enterococcus hirae]|nr:site-specific integrase [Enterococcus hirae]
EKSFIWYPFFLIIFDQGLRKSEALGLQWADIDFSQNTLNINRERLGAAEKGPNKGLIITDDTKTPSGTRSLPMTKRVKKALLTLRNQVIKKFGFLPETDDHEAFIFINTYGKNKGIPIRDRTVNGASHRIEKRANLPHITVHDGRHTFAARTRQAGIPLEDIKDFLGHKDVSTTQVYAHISPEVKKRSMNQLENYIEEQIKKHSN